jgi:hypothetical protein
MDKLRVVKLEKVLAKLYVSCYTVGMSTIVGRRVKDRRNELDLTQEDLTRLVQDLTGGYVCSQRKRWHACDNPYVQESVITDQVGAWLDNVAADVRIAVALADQELALPALPNRDKELAELERRRERITALYETGRIELAEWDRRMAALDAAKAEIGSQIASVEDARDRLAQQRLQRQAMAEAAPVFRERLAALDPRRGQPLAAPVVPPRRDRQSHRRRRPRLARPDRKDTVRPDRVMLSGRRNSQAARPGRFFVSSLVMVASLI